MKEASPFWCSFLMLNLLFEQNLVVHLHKNNEKQIGPCKGKRRLNGEFCV